MLEARANFSFCLSFFIMEKNVILSYQELCSQSHFLEHQVVYYCKNGSQIHEYFVSNYCNAVVEPFHVPRIFGWQTEYLVSVDTGTSPLVNYQYDTHIHN